MTWYTFLHNGHIIISYKVLALFLMPFLQSHPDLNMEDKTDKAGGLCKRYCHSLPDYLYKCSFRKSLIFRCFEQWSSHAILVHSYPISKYKVCHSDDSELA